MKRPLLFFALISSCLILNAQNQIKISKPELSYLNNILTINYDITGCGTGDYIEIKIIILNSKGDTIRPAYVTGDLGKRVTCGFEKKIEWNILKDSVLIDEDIEVQVTGKQVIQEIVNYGEPTSRLISRGNIILSSVIVPGLGQKKASGKGAHLITSGLVYGSVGASVYFILKSKKYYNDYQEASGTLRDELFDKSTKTFDSSQYFLYGAIGAWAINFIWSAVIPIRENDSKKINMSLISGPQNSHLVSARWTF